MNEIASQTKGKSQTSPLLGSRILQRKCVCGSHTMAGEECAKCARSKNRLQRKFNIGASNDPLEHEADRIADQIMSMPANPLIGTSSLQIQRFTSRATTETDVVPSSVDRVLASSGHPLEHSLQQDMEQRFGYDFSSVRVHSGSTAEQSARDVNAHAYTVGNTIVFGANKFAPETYAGRRLIAHELAHVVQQEGIPKTIQRLIRTPYPWRGIILPAGGANVRSSPDGTRSDNILDAIPQGQTVTVLSETGGWLKTKNRYRGPELVGYIHHTLVDDATSSAMAQSVGASMTWTPSGPGSGTDFESWASASTESPFPTVTSNTVMNCWEAVLLSAYRAGSINWSWIHRLYTSTPTSDWVSALSRGARRRYAIPGPNLPIQRGDIVFFDGLAHVALATGNGSEVYTFWPPPNTPFSPNGTIDRVKIYTIEDLVVWWEANMPAAPVVEFGAPSW